MEESSLLLQTMQETGPETAAQPVLPRREAVHALLEQRDFVLLWVGQLLSQIGDQCLLIAAVTLITHLPLTFPPSPFPPSPCGRGRGGIMLRTFPLPPP
jgi:hypothetical protein